MLRTAGRGCDVDKIKILMKTTLYELSFLIAKILKYHKQPLLNIYTSLVNHLDVWVLHNLSEKHLMKQISVCDSFYKQNEDNQFFRNKSSWIKMDCLQQYGTNKIVRQKRWAIIINSNSRTSSESNALHH